MENRLRQANNHTLYFLVLIVIITLGGTMLDLKASESEHLYYGIDIDLNGIGVDIRLNDIPVYYDKKSGQLTVEMSVSSSIIDDLNLLTIHGFLPKGVDTFNKGSYVNVVLFWQDLAVDQVKKHSIATLEILIEGDNAVISATNFDTKESSNQSLSLTDNVLINASTDVNIKSPFPRWQWQDGKVIENSQANFDSLLNVYSDIHDALENKDLNALKVFYKERARETAISYNLPDVEAGYSKLSLGEDMVDSTLRLYKLHVEGIALEILANGQLARIRDHLHAQPIVFTQSNPFAAHLHKFMFYKNANDEWVMIR